MIRVVLTDDHKLFREGISALLKDEETIEIVGEAAEGSQLIQLLERVPVDVVLLDLHMPGKSAAETISYIKAHYPDTKVLVLSMIRNERSVHEAMEAGASGYVLKSNGKDELIMAIKLVAQGANYICSNLTMDLLRKQNLGKTAEGLQWESDRNDEVTLTKRELEILRLIAEGLTNADIAEKLFTSKRTVETHRQNLLDKTQTKNTATLIRYAIRKGLIS